MGLFGGHGSRSFQRRFHFRFTGVAAKSRERSDVFKNFGLVFNDGLKLIVHTFFVGQWRFRCDGLACRSVFLNVNIGEVATPFERDRSMIPTYVQCDQIWWHFATLAQFLSLGQNLDRLFSIWQNFELTWANFFCLWATFHCLKWPKSNKPSDYTATWHIIINLIQ